MDERPLLRLQPELDRFLDRFAPLFGRDENRGHARRFVQGLLRGGDRRNAENIAEVMAGGPGRNLQAFLTTGAWSDRAVLAELRGVALDALADPDAVLNVDDTGFPKEGAASVGGPAAVPGDALPGGQLTDRCVRQLRVGARARPARSPVVPAGRVRDPGVGRVTTLHDS